ncbi:hypothetical protein BGZ73_006401 [Actinomortierella ambigua]|nr:hypothetical protein BGZ73_006401 [Actinomortierella ambigua]
MPVVADNTQYPNHAREYSPTEKIESIDTMSFQRLFQKREGIFFHVSGSVFTIKATRREFTPPEPVRIPPFVRTAIEGYEHQYSQYNQALQQYIQQDRSESALDSGAGTASPCFDPTTTINSNLHHIPEPKPPIIPFTVQQFLHKPLRHPPETRESIHAPYRVSVASPKKTISKLAVYRTLCRRKFYQAVENVFRGRAQPGFDYLIFAGKDSLKTPQSRLEQLLINALEDQRLHASRVWPVSSHSQDMRKKGNTRNNAASAAEKVTLAVHDVVDHPSSLAQPTDGTKAAAHVSHASHAKQRKDDDDIHMQDNPKDGPSHKSIRLRYRNDQKPPFQKFWKHALPNPLPRKTFRESYLDLYADKGEPGSPEHQRAVILRQRQGMWLHRRRLLNNENQLKAVEAAKERQKVLAQYRNYVESLIEKHFAERS